MHVCQLLCAQTSQTLTLHRRTSPLEVWMGRDRLVVDDDLLDAVPVLDQARPHASIDIVDRVVRPVRVGGVDVNGGVLGTDHDTRDLAANTQHQVISCLQTR